MNLAEPEIGALLAKCHDRLDMSYYNKPIVIILVGGVVFIAS